MFVWKNKWKEGKRMSISRSDQGPKRKFIRELCALMREKKYGLHLSFTQVHGKSEKAQTKRIGGRAEAPAYGESLDVGQCFQPVHERFVSGRGTDAPAIEGRDKSIAFFTPLPHAMPARGGYLVARCLHRCLRSERPELPEIEAYLPCHRPISFQQANIHCIPF